MHFSLVRISTPHMPNTRAFDDVLLPMLFALRRLGYEAEIRLNSFNPQSRNICLGANYDPEQKWLKIPPDSIILNLEQLEASGYPWLKDDKYFNLLAAHECWDFSRRNLDFLTGKGIEARFLPLGYVPEMTRLKPCPAPLSDVLFYGAMTPRRRQVLDELRAAGLTVDCLTKAYGRARDQAIYATRLFLNIHHSLPASLEVVRLGYILANSRPVVSELAPGAYHYPELAEACAFAEYERLVPTITELLADEPRRQALARRGFEAFSSLSLEESLADLVGRRAGAGKAPSPARPKHLRVEAGADFLDEALNVDSRACFQPDIVLDFSRPLPSSRLYPTERFGPVGLEPGSFDCLSVPGLLNMVENPDQLMKSFLDLLEPGGRLLLTLPYDLSGAPAVRRSFNENSWHRYGLQAVALGWTEAVFQLESLEYNLSDYGRVLQAKGWSREKLSRAPRAVDSLRVVLVKKVLSPKDLEEALASTRAFYNVPARAWDLESLTRSEADIDRPVQEKLPSALGLLSKLAALRLKRWRYILQIRHKVPGRHGRYQEKLAAVEAEIRRLKDLLKMY